MDNIESSIRTVGLIQMVCTPDPAQNLQTAIQSIREAAKKGAQIICLPELFLSNYFCQTENPEHFSLAEPIPGPTSNTLAQLAKELEIVLIVPLFEKRTEGIYHNSTVILDADGSIAGTYRKMHIPDDPCFFEKYYFTPGDSGYKSFPTRYGKVAVLICWDQWFPEAARLTALTGAQFIFYPTAIGFQECDREESAQQISAWETIQKSHAISNGLFVASVNRVGKEKDLTFWGRSFICNPFGKVLQQAEGNKAQIIISSCTLDEIETTRHNWPFLRDRRIDSYKNLNKIFIDSDE
ncbi:MAG: carbon-nitrogen hydrolase [Nitrospinae bacterium]|nr:carbon-nitrogen hydrolase [Nitrospinota bacterium]